MSGLKGALRLEQNGDTGFFGGLDISTSNINPKRPSQPSLQTINPETYEEIPRPKP